MFAVAALVALEQRHTPPPRRALSLTLRFLGTSASRPTVERGVTAISVVREGETLLFDCGEGTQRQMMRYGVGFTLEDIFFSHYHADHLLGLIGLLRTMSLQGRTERMRLWGPKGGARILKQAVTFGNDRITFPVEITELEPGAPVKRKDYDIVPYAVDHQGSASLGYALVERERLGRFNPERARELGIPEGPLWGQLHRGQAVTLADGTVVEPATLVGVPRRGRRVVITGDTRPCAATIEMAQGADVLVHEATFADEEAARAMETGHSTAREAGIVAAAAGVKRLVLTHFSARYSRDPSDLDREAKLAFPHVTCARDGMEIEVPYEADDSGSAN